jgi:hypothetical protein
LGCEPLNSREDLTQPVGMQKERGPMLVNASTARG